MSCVLSCTPLTAKMRSPTCTCMSGFCWFQVSTMPSTTWMLTTINVLLSAKLTSMPRGTEPLPLDKKTLKVSPVRWALKPPAGSAFLGESNWLLATECGDCGVSLMIFLAQTSSAWIGPPGSSSHLPQHEACAPIGDPVHAVRSTYERALTQSGRLR
eukprot:CAMPEP_0203966484 /NCGR_PEP_ID=MMETSP0359-20131031/95703_1 /ASSEMBLY_ACC=CAM_ASM_000338 /TAXON_ID=268821 /ORGANISM="Scrippsiella Hangoei, Strain SHTV-5" /LENGTH=156 /DNA_ID=CAMNT_0050903879 /DNA_START=142 /DNA_END=609 /DNA_ORIENTATION=-